MPRSCFVNRLCIGPGPPSVRNIARIAAVAASSWRLATPPSWLRPRLRFDAGVLMCQCCALVECDEAQVWQARGSEVLQLRAADAAMDSLGSIVGHCDLQAALQQCVLATDVTCIGSAARTISSLPPAAAAAAGHVLTAGDFSVSCSLLVGCDGAASRVRSHSGIGRSPASMFV
jgi:hypothetical protein